MYWTKGYLEDICLLWLMYCQRVRCIRVVRLKMAKELDVMERCVAQVQLLCYVCRGNNYIGLITCACIYLVYICMYVHMDLYEILF